MPTINSRRIALSACFVFAATLLSGAVPAVFGQSGEMPLTGSKEAVALFRQGLEKAENLEDPGTLFDQAIAKDPNFAFAYLYAGQNNVEARKNLETAVKLADKASPGEREWIMAVWEQNNANRAESLKHLEQLMKLHPRDKRVLGQMAGFYNGVDDNMSLKYLNEAVKIDKNYAPAYNSIGYANMALGKYPEAEQAFKTYIKLIPNNSNPYDSYAEFLMKTGRFDESIKQYNMSLSKDPTFVASYRGMGDDYMYKGDYAKARETFQMMYDKSTNAFNRDQALQSMMNAWLAEGNYEKALEVNQRRIAAAEAIGDKGTAMGLHSVAGFVGIESGDLDRAAKEFDMARTLSEDPSLPAVLAVNRRFNMDLNQARLMAARGNFEAARAALDSAAKYTAANSANVNATRNYNGVAGYVEMKQKNYAKAADHFAKAFPNDPYAWYYRAEALEASGDAKTAADLYRKVAEWNQLDTPGFAVVRLKAVGKVNKSKSGNTAVR
jgi:tetratricopeptide (TPR) repeat protein